MQRLDSMLQKMIPTLERAQPDGGREGTLSPIAEETQEQVASSSATIEIQEAPVGEQATSSWYTTPPNWLGAPTSSYETQVPRS